jgi:hypothetical protein
MEILAQAAGLSEAEIRELERTGVVGTEIKDESLNGSEL